MSLIRDTIFYSVASSGRRLVGFATAPIIIAYFTPAEYGYMSLVTTLASFCSILGMLGIIDQGLPRFFIGAEGQGEKVRYVSTAFVAGAIGVSLLTVLIFAATPLVKYFVEGVESPLVFTATIALVCFGQSFVYVGINMLKWTCRASLFMRITLLQTILGAGLIIPFVILFGFRAKGVLLITALVAIAAGVWANWSVRDYVRSTAISKGKLKELAGYSWPLLGLNVFAFFTRSLDRIFLAAIGSLGAVGIFSVSYMVASIFEILVSGFFLRGAPICFPRSEWIGRPNDTRNILAHCAALAS